MLFSWLPCYPFIFPLKILYFSLLSSVYTAYLFKQNLYLNFTKFNMLCQYQSVNCFRISNSQISKISLRTRHPASVSKFLTSSAGSWMSPSANYLNKPRIRPTFNRIIIYTHDISWSFQQNFHKKYIIFEKKKTWKQSSPPLLPRSIWIFSISV